MFGIIKSNLFKKMTSYNQCSHIYFSLYFPEQISKDIKERLAKCLMIINDFITKEEETSLVQELEPYMKRLRYEYDHWDDKIHGYRETERRDWNPTNTAILDRVRDLALPEPESRLPHVHVLDLAEEGYIKPHLDSVKFCGDTIAGLSLLSDSVMRLTKIDEENLYCDMLLKRRSLYIMK